MNLNPVSEVKGGAKDVLTLAKKRPAFFVAFIVLVVVFLGSIVLTLTLKAKRAVEKVPVLGPQVAKLPDPPSAIAAK